MGGRVRDRGRAVVPPPPGMLSWPGRSPSCPIAPVPIERLGPWNTLSWRAAVGMMERRAIFFFLRGWLFLTAHIHGQSPSRPGEETSREGGDQNSRPSQILPTIPSPPPDSWA